MTFLKKKKKKPRRFVEMFLKLVAVLFAYRFIDSVSNASGPSAVLLYAMLEIL